MPEGEVVDALSRRDAIDLKALDDIMRGGAKSINYYYGETATEPSQDADYWAKVLVNNHPEEAQEYLNIRDAEFKPSKVAMNALSEHLEEEHEMDRQVIERVNEDYYKLLVLVFHATYDPDNGLGREYDRLMTLVKVFDRNSEEKYYHDGSSFEVDEVEQSLTQFVRDQNDGAAHGFAVDSTKDGETEIVLNLFKETSRTGERVFSFRKEGRDEPPSEPSIEYDSTHNIKTIGLRARNTDAGTEFVLSKGRSGWKSDLGDLFESVFDVAEPWETLREHQVRGATQIVEGVKETADDEEATEEEVVNRADTALTELAEVATDEMEQDEEVSEEEVERLNNLAESGTLIGFEISQDEKTGTAEFSVEAEDEFVEWMNNIDDIEAGAKALMARADRENLNLIYEVETDDGETERIRVSDGKWSPTGRGIDSETSALVERLLTASFENEE